MQCHIISFKNEILTVLNCCTGKLTGIQQKLYFKADMNNGKLSKAGVTSCEADQDPEDKILSLSAGDINSLN